MRQALTTALLAFVACSDPAPGPAVSIVTVSPPSITLGVGGSSQLSVIARDASLNPVNASASWRSSNTTVATVSGEGLVVARAVGNATITATVSGISGESLVSVASGPSTSAVVSMPGNSFVPADVRIAVGGRVTFQFPSIPHNVIFARTTPGAPEDIQVTSNRNVDRVFPVEGSFPYDCTLHPGMVGRVTVVR
jgi:plastocyanin